MITFTHADQQYILFFGTADVYSQFHPSEYTVVWKHGKYEYTVDVPFAEMFMMYAKAIVFGDEAAAEKILAAKTPAACKKLGRTVKNYDDDTWNRYAFDVVVTSNYYKFKSNKTWKKELIDTGDAILVEASSWDKKWGTGMTKEDTKRYIVEHDEVPNGNLLGKAIMKVRELLKKD